MSAPPADGTNPRPGTAPRLAVVTVAYESLEVLRPFFDSLPTALPAGSLVIVADNRPDERVAALALEHGAEYLPLPGNPGYGGAVNAARARIPASVEWILVANPDSALTPGSVARLIDTGDSDAAIGSVGPAILNDDGTVYPSARRIPSLRTGVGHALFANIWADNPWTAAYRDGMNTTSVRRDAGWLSGACVLVRRSAFDELGGFDEGFFMYFEDVDLGYRLGKHGYRNVYEPAAAVSHLGAHSTTGESARMIVAHHASARRFLDKKYAHPVLWPLRVALHVGLRLRSALLRRRVPSGI
ncbi:MAG: glycosyltransferase family 2 protein [Microbacteriaceae bacterium]